jgi:hypothetical protein
LRERELVSVTSVDAVTTSPKSVIPSYRTGGLGSAVVQRLGFSS